MRSPTNLSRGPAYRIETDRLVLRGWSPADAPRVRAALDRSAAELRPFIPFMKDEPRSLAETVDWLRQLRAAFDRDESYRYAIFDREDGRLLGETMLLDRANNGEREIGYWMDSAEAGRGIATEGAAIMTRVAFEIDRVDRVEIQCVPANAASAAIPRKLGYRHEATLRRRVTNADARIDDLMVWTLFRAEYPSTPAARTSLHATDALGATLIDR